MRNKLCKIFGLLRMLSVFFWGFLALQKPGRRKRMVMLPLVLFGLVAAVCCASVPSSVSALDDNVIGAWNQGFSNFYFVFNNSGTNCKGGLGNQRKCVIPKSGTQYYQLQGIDLSFGSETITKNDFVTFSFQLFLTQYPSTFKFYGFTGGGSWVLDSQDIVYADKSSMTVFLKFRYMGSSPTHTLNIGHGQAAAIEFNSAASSPGEVAVSGYSVTHYSDGAWFQDAINSVNNKVNSIDNKLSISNDILTSIRDKGIVAKVDQSGVINAVNKGNDQAHKDSQAQLGALEEQNRLQAEQNKQEQDRYEQDKQEEADREDAANDASKEAQGMFSFTFLNPFIGIFELFNSSGCVEIPTIARWVHSDTSTVCPWFSQEVRDVLTPVFGLSSMMLLFGFAVSWLNGNDSNGSITIKGGIK